MEETPFRLLCIKEEKTVTIQEALDMADQLKPNMMITPVKLRFLNEIEGKIYQEIILEHEYPEGVVQTETTETETPADDWREILTCGRRPWKHPDRPEYNRDTDPGTDLLVPAPYDMLYVYWLIAQIDHMNMEMDKYNNDRLLFEDAYGNFSDFWTRTHMPIPKARRFSL